MSARILACASLVALITSCTTTAPVDDPPPFDPLDQVWSETIRRGDIIVAVPGTSTYTTLGAYIEDHAPAEIDARAVLNTVEVLEAELAAAVRAGFTAAEIEGGAVTLALWGSGITKLTSFRYRSLDGLHVTFVVIGGTSVCAVGGIPENLGNYNAANADKDARDLYRRTQAFVATLPPADRNIVLVSHSWGGLVAEFFASNLATYTHDHGPLARATIAFVQAAGVPPLVPGYTPYGPGFRTVGDATRVYEVDRPDDPAHTFSPTGNGGGHHYVIMFGDVYQGWYGITTDELACAGTPGICPSR
jgi:hypothetical protein